MKSTPWPEICSYSFSFLRQNICQHDFVGTRGLFPALLSISSLYGEILCRLLSFNSQKNPRRIIWFNVDLGENSQLSIFSPSTNYTEQGWDAHGAGNPDMTSCKVLLVPKASTGFTKALLLPPNSEIFLLPLVILTIFSLCLSTAQHRCGKRFGGRCQGKRKKNSQLYVSKASSVGENNAKRKQFSSWHWTSLL